jgi:formate/nitrite transporter FocA (FNT family)
MYNSKELMHYACDVGEEKLKKSLLSVFISSILAGLFIGLGYMGFLYLSKYFHYGYVFSERYFASVTFGTGLVMIIIAGGELFTGNCLLTMGAYAKRYSFFKVMGNLGLVWIGNFVGAIFLVFLVCFSVNYEEIIPQITTLSEVKNNMVFLEAFFKGILCNILVSMAIYLLCIQNYTG